MRHPFHPRGALRRLGEAVAIAITSLLPFVEAAAEIAASTSYLLPGAPGRLTELSGATPVPLADGGTAFIGKLEGTGETMLVIRRPAGLTVVPPSALGLFPANIASPFIRLAGNGAEVLFAATYLSSTPGVSRVGVFRADPGGPTLLVADVVAAAGQFRNGWNVPEWVARDGVFAMLSSYSVGRVGFGTSSSTVSIFRAGSMAPIAVSRSDTPGFAGFDQLALFPQGARLYFRGILSSASASGKLNTFEAGIYAWENGALATILDPQTRFAAERISVASFGVSDDGAIGFFDSRRTAIALFADNRIVELVAGGARAADGTLIELDQVHAVPRVLRVDARHVYFTAARRIMNPWGEEGVRDDLIFRVPHTGGPAEVFFHPARLLRDATLISISGLALTGTAPQLTFQVREIWGTQHAIYRATAPFGPIAFPAVPPGYPSVVLKASWPDGFYHRAGATATVEAKVEGPGPFTFEWFRNAERVTAAQTPQVRATAGTLTLFPFAQSYHSADYTVAVTNAAGTSVVTAPVSVGFDSISDGGSPPALVNYSVRGFSTMAEGIFTAGLSLLPPIELSYPNSGRVLRTIAGTTQRLLIRAVGPGLAPFAGGDVRPAPATRLELFNGSQVIQRNDGAWSSDPAMAQTAASVGAFPLVPGSRDSALLTSLAPGSYTVQASAPASDGTVLLECYVVEGRGNLRNISARGLVADVEPRSLTLGFVISGAGARPVLLRAVGPGLQGFGVNNTALRPRLELFSGANMLLAENSSHETAPNSAALEGAAREYGAFPLAPGSADAALLLHLPAGVYIARVAAAPGSTSGVALIELYTNLAYDLRP